MPTIDQLPSATSIADTDLVAVEQSGTLRATTKAQLVAGLQPAIAVPPESLLGNPGPGTSAPVPVAVGANLVLNNGTLVATPAPLGIAGLPPANAPQPGDLVPLGQGGTDASVSYAEFTAGLQPQIAVASGMVLGRASPGTGGIEALTVGANLAVSNGTISSTIAPFTIASLPPGTPPAATDLVPLGQAGANNAVSYAELTSGLQPALAVPAGTLLGRSSAGTGAPETVNVGANLALTAGTLSSLAAPFTVAGLPPAHPLAPSDLVALGQGGANVAASVSQLTAGLQPAISLSSGTLLGRSSAGAGGVEPLSVGANLALANGTLSSTTAPFSVTALPPAAAPAAGDLVALGQGGVNKAASVGQLTAGLQATLTVSSGSLLGRVSPGSGGPEPVQIGANLSLAAGTLSSTASSFSIPALPSAASVGTADLVPISQNGAAAQASVGQLLSGVQPALTIASGTLLGRVSAAAGQPEPVTIGANLALTGGTLSSSAPPLSLAQLPVANTPALTDQVLIAQGGTNKTASYGTFMAGLSEVGGLNVSSAVAQATEGTVQRVIADTMADSINVRSLGAVGDGQTDDTAALQQAINLAQATGTNGLSKKRVYLPAGVYVVGPLSITRPVELRGDGSRTTFISLKSGSTAPCLSLVISHDGVDYVDTGPAPPAVVTIEGVQITSPNNADIPGANVAHGIATSPASVNPVYTRIYLRDVAVYGMPSDGFNSSGGITGFTVTHACVFKANGRDNFSVNSGFDFRLADTEFAEAKRDNILLSGCGGFVFKGCNIYTAGRYNVFCYAGNPIGRSSFVGCAFDTAAQYGLLYQHEVQDAPLTLIGCHFANNGVSAPGTYSDIYLAGGANSDLSLVGCSFDAPNSVKSTNGSKYNIQHDPGAATASVSIGSIWLEAPVLNAFSNPYQIQGNYFVSGSAQSSWQIGTPIEIVHPYGMFQWTDPTQPTNDRKWALQNNSQQLVGLAMSDNLATTARWLTVTRASNVSISAVHLGGGPGQTPFVVNLSAGFANGVEVLSAPSGQGPTIQPVGADAAIGMTWATVGGAPHTFTAPVAIGAANGQSLRMILRGQTSNSAVPIYLTTDGNPPGPGNIPVFAGPGTWHVTARLLGENPYSADAGVWALPPVMVRCPGGPSSVVVVGNFIFVPGTQSGDGVNWAAGLFADTTHGGILIKVHSSPAAGAIWTAELTILRSNAL